MYKNTICIYYKNAVYKMEKLSIMCSVTQNRSEINMKRKIFLRVLICAFLIVVLIAGICEQLQEGIAAGVVRLHIIANSDSERDQKIKLLVRDEIIRTQREIFDDDIKKELNEEEKEKILKCVHEVLFNSGTAYDAKIETGNFYFPVKEYENITLPAGNYDAVRVVLGEGKGENWWCVMYPPLCFTDSAVGSVSRENMNLLKNSMGKVEYEIISGEKIKTVPALKIFELWQELKENVKILVNKA